MNKIYDIESVLDFGKHKGKTILQIFTGDKKGLRDNLAKIVFDEYVKITFWGGTRDFIPIIFFDKKQHELGRSYLQPLLQIHAWMGWVGLTDPDISEGQRLRVRYEGDPGYLEWGINKEKDPFIISPDAIEKLETLVVVHLKEIKITVDETDIDKLNKEMIQIRNIYDVEYDLEYDLSFYKFLEETKKKNEDKYKKMNSENSDQNEDYNDRDYSTEKYGGYNGHSDETIDDAFDGDPELTWNID